MDANDKKPLVGRMSSSRHTERLNKLNGSGVAPPAPAATPSSTPPSATKTPPVVEAKELIKDDPDASFEDFDLGNDAPLTKEEKPAVVEEKKDDQKTSSLADDDLEDIDNLDPRAENFKKLREGLKSQKKKYKDAVAELSTIKSQLQEYETGERVASRVEELEKIIAELEPKAQLVDFKSSPAYREAYIKPIEDSVTKLKELASEYNVPEEVLDEAVNATSRVERNKILSRYFGDELGASEAKSLIQRINDTRKAQAEAETRPSDALKELIAKKEEQEREEIAQRMDQIDFNSKVGWRNAIHKIQQENKYPELVLGPDAEFNENIVLELRRQGAKLHGQTIKQLASIGIKELPEDIAENLAMKSLLAIQGLFATQCLQRVQEENAELKKKQAELDAYSRPGANGIRTPADPKPSYGLPVKGPRATARRLLDRVNG